MNTLKRNGLKTSRLASIIALALVNVIQQQDASAGLVQYEFTGTITSIDDPSGTLPHSIIAGSSTFTGTFSYDDTTPDFDSDPSVFFNFGAGTAGAIELIINGEFGFRRELDSPDTTTLIRMQNDSIGGTDDFIMANGSAVVASSSHPGLFSTTMQFQLQDAGAKDLLSNDVLSDADLRFSSLTSTNFQLHGNNHGGATESFVVRGSFDSLSRVSDVAVPEPSSLALLGMGGLTLLGYGRRRNWRGQPHPSNLEQAT